MLTANDYVYEVYKEKSFTLAAKKLFVSQPALSASIKKIETEIGAKIFDRSTSPITLTEAGKAYIEALEQIYATEENLKNRINDINDLKTGSVSIGGSNFMSSCVLPDIITNYAAKYPGITLNVVENTSENLKKLVLDGEIDVVIDYDFNDKEFTSFPLKEEIIYLSASKSSRVAESFGDCTLTANDIIKGNTEKQSIDLKLLSDEKFLLLKKGNDMEMHATKLFKEAEIYPQTFLMLDQMMTSYALTKRGLALTFVTDTLIKANPSDDCVFFRIASPYAARTISIAHKKNRYVGKCLSAFIDVTRETVK